MSTRALTDLRQRAERVTASRYGHFAAGLSVCGVEQDCATGVGRQCGWDGISCRR